MDQEQVKYRPPITIAFEHSPLPFPLLANIGKAFTWHTGRRKTKREEREVARNRFII
jgi:hypothetical protein